MKPCLITEAYVVEGRESYHRHPGITLQFNEQVKVKKTSLDKFSFTDSLIIFGSNLGKGSFTAQEYAELKYTQIHINMKIVIITDSPVSCRFELPDPPRIVAWTWILSDSRICG